MPEQQVKAAELHEAEEILDVVLPSGDEAAEGVHPGEEPFYFPAATVATQLSPILSLAAPAPIGCDQFDVVFLGELLVELVRVVGFVADEPGREFVEEASGKNLLHKLALGR
jgi:hypothetical protein